VSIEDEEHGLGVFVAVGHGLHHHNISTAGDADNALQLHQPFRPSPIAKLAVKYSLPHQHDPGLPLIIKFKKLQL
jgi:hypothetical protein